MERRTPLGKFIKTTWTNMNIRAGKYRHLQTQKKCLSYNNVEIKFTREEFKKWCEIYKDHILSLKRPSIDRLNRNEDYTLHNIRVIELAVNIRKDKTKFTNTAGECYRCKQTLPLSIFAKDKRRQNGLTNVCRPCDNARRY